MRYMHTITVNVVTESSTDNKGHWNESVKAPAKTYQCRYEPASGIGVIRGDDGTAINYTAIVYMPADTPLIPAGSQVTINVDGKEITDTVQRHHKGLMNVRLWL